MHALSQIMQQIGMKDKRTESDGQIEMLTSDSARQRWQLFHRAIAHAKAINAASMQDSDGPCEECDNVTPYLTLVR